jgi:glycine reductase
VLITAFTSIALSVGVNRVLAGNQFTSPAGFPELPPDREREFQKQMMTIALEALATPVQEPTLFHLSLEE